MNEWVYFVPYCGLLQLPIFLSVSTTKLDVVLGQKLSALFTRTVCPKGKGKCQTVVYKVRKEGRDGRPRSSKSLSSSLGGQVSSWNNLRMTVGYTDSGDSSEGARCPQKERRCELEMGCLGLRGPEALPQERLARGPTR